MHGQRQEEPRVIYHLILVASKIPDLSTKLSICTVVFVIPSNPQLFSFSSALLRCLIKKCVHVL